MSTLTGFSKEERDYHAYQARQNYLRQQRSIQKELDQERQERLVALQQEAVALQREAVALQREAAAVQEKQAAVQEIERLKALLAVQGQGH